MDKFLSHKDELGAMINACATELHKRFQQIDVDSLGLPQHCLDYFKSSHSRRLFFSIETSAHLLYRSIKMTGRPPHELTLMDYGAGVGTLYLLAKMIGFKQVIYNDHLDDWRLSAQLIAEAVQVRIDQYIVGDIDICLNRLDETHLQCNIITSRNVIEHIYALDTFFSALRNRQPNAIIVSSTTANRTNPASVIKHITWHRKCEKIYKAARFTIIDLQLPSLSESEKLSLADATRGLAGTDLQFAIDRYNTSGVLPNRHIHRSNTCDPANGVWAEHLLSQKDYRQLINEKLYTVSFAPGFWDTHYNNKLMNAIGNFFNRIIAKNGRSAIFFAPFIYVITRPR